MGVACGWNLWCCYNVYVWLVGVVVRRYIIDILKIINNFSYSTCISSFLAAVFLHLCSFFKCFFGLYIIYNYYIYVYTSKIYTSG